MSTARYRRFRPRAARGVALPRVASHHELSAAGETPRRCENPPQVIALTAARDRKRAGLGQFQDRHAVGVAVQSLGWR